MDDFLISLSRNYTLSRAVY